jgi:tetratricopeptide (TPR) repeat protein
VIRSFTSSDTQQRRAVLDSEVAPAVVHEVARIVPELRSSAQPVGASAAQVDPESARFRLFDSVATLLRSFGRSQPLLIVIDDLHDADLASLAMLKFVAGEVHHAHILIVGTYRDAEMHRSPERLKLIEETLREGNQLPLAGLAQAEVGSLVETRTGRQANEAFVAKLHWLTAGNPLFIDGVVRALAADGKLGQLYGNALAGIKLPDNVRGAIAGRLGMLSEQVRSVVARAAVIGLEFELALFARVSELTPHLLTAALDEASEVGIVVSAGRDRYRFTHPLIREALCTGKKDSTRVSAHRAIGEAIEHLHATDLTPHLAQLAHHFREAGMVEQAIDYSIRAGETANAVFAYQEAAEQFQAALDLMEKAGVDGERRASLFLRQYIVTFSFDEARCVAILEQLLKLNEAAHRMDRLVWVHSELGIRHTTFSSMMDIPKAIEHVQRAEAALVEAPSERSRARLDYVIALVCWNQLRIAEGLGASSRAKEIAVRLDDRILCVHLDSTRALLLLYAGHLAEGFALLEEARRTADALNHQGALYAANVPSMGFRGFIFDPRQQMTLAERELAKPRTKHATFHQAYYKSSLHPSLATMGRLAEAKRYNWDGGIEAWVALFEGRWEESEKQCGDKVDWMTNCGARAEWHGWFFLLAWARRLLRKWSLTEGQLLDSIALCQRETLFSVDMWNRSELTLLYADMNRHAEAQPHVEQCREIMAAGEEWRGLGGHAYLADAVVTAADGNGEDAERLFARALEVFGRYTLPFDTAETFLYWGRALKATGDPRANEKFDAAVEIYRRHEAGQRWIDRVESERRASRLSPSEARRLDVVIGEGAEGPAMFRREGEFWTLGYRGTTFRLRDLKGLAYIAYLLAHPGERIHVHELIARVDGVAHTGSEMGAEVARDVPVTSGLGDAGSALDQHALADYRRELRELAEELAEAERLNDMGRAERIRVEMEFLKGELSAAVGIGGRNRRAAAQVERARGMVRKNIRAGLAKIRSEDAALGRHFATSIKTGYCCAYLPDPDRKISWQL